MKEDIQRNMGRRRFLGMTGVLCAGCALGGSVSGAALAERIVDAGPVGNYAKDGVYDKFRSQGFFVIRRDGKLFVLSAVCTHKKCKLTAEKDRSFYCDCHGSTFDPNGKVTEGPAKRDLPHLSTRVNEQGHMLVYVFAG